MKIIFNNIHNKASLQSHSWIPSPTFCCNLFIFFRLPSLFFPPGSTGDYIVMVLKQNLWPHRQVFWKSEITTIEWFNRIYRLKMSPRKFKRNQYQNWGSFVDEWHVEYQCDLNLGSRSRHTLGFFFFLFSQKVWAWHNIGRTERQMEKYFYNPFPKTS